MKRKDIQIILVDDNIHFRTYLKDYIEIELGYTVVAEASNGIELLSLPGNINPTVILMDLVMDEMDGYETTKQILWRNRYLKVIAVTFHLEDVYLVRLLETGFKGCIFKPDLYNQLPEAIDAVVKGRWYFPENIVL